MDIGEPFLIREAIPAEAPDFGEAFIGPNRTQLKLGA